MTRAVCELRYSDAHLIFDRTGQVIHDAKAAFTEVRVLSATPTQSAFQSEQGSFALEIGQSRFATDKPDWSLEQFAGNCQKYFEIVLECLEVKILTRIGMRVLFRKTLKDIEESRAELRALNLFNRKPAKRFGAAEHPDEVIIRWESTQVGAMLRFKAETGTIDVVLPPELETPDVHKSITGVIVDIDYYTIAPVERAQWDARAWIPQSIRTVKKEIDSILEG